MSTYSTVRHRAPAGVHERRGAGGRLAVARLITTVASVVAAIIVVGILLIVFEASRGNDIVGLVLDAARWLVGPFKGLFDLDSQKLQVAVNWGLAALVYTLVARLIARLLAR